MSITQTYEAMLIQFAKKKGVVGGVTDTAGKTVSGVTDNAGNAGKPIEPCFWFFSLLHEITKSFTAVGGVGNTVSDATKGLTGTVGDTAKGAGNTVSDTTSGVGDTAKDTTGAGKHDAQNPLGL